MYFILFFIIFVAIFVIVHALFLFFAQALFCFLEVATLVAATGIAWSKRSSKSRSKNNDTCTSVLTGGHHLLYFTLILISYNLFDFFFYFERQEQEKYK